MDTVRNPPAPTPAHTSIPTPPATDFTQPESLLVLNQINILSERACILFKNRSGCNGTSEGDGVIGPASNSVEDSMVSGLNLTLCRGERMAVLGPSGVGKTRLLRLISQLDPIREGEMILNLDLTEASEQQGLKEPRDGYLSIRAEDGSVHRATSTTALKISTNGIERVGKTSNSVLNLYDSSGVDILLWRKRCVYLQQAFPAMSGTPLELLQECEKYSVRKGKGRTTGEYNWLVYYVLLLGDWYAQE